ncbi:hypothetical protein FHW88_005167 [Mucilaginibacter sp. SG538B]|uniref:DUF3883 domain-containing protein n=1 Tax=Mucilaginibacter sp. SG538B TaxID=2587021 RepID=UPI00159E8DFC|nr:DUF3883 domain-containing protein [Mucilaginibacter sp. SG538B]NVM66849.1 hypothetical protein [Mucilaginibacter sp. SG538B]
MITTPKPATSSAINYSGPTDIQQMARDQLDQIRQIYAIQPKQVLENYLFEFNTTSEYNGRQLLELIQNADDAAQGTPRARMLISLEGDRLIVANQGQTFSPDGLDSIFSGHLSPKYNQKNQIGNKGLGFRSILNWSTRVTIKSGALQIAFSEQFSHQIFEELLDGDKGPELRERVTKRFGRLFPAISVLRVPDVLDEILLPAAYEGFDTVIMIDLRSGITAQITEQLDERINAEMMLFLNNLETVSIRVPGHDRDFGRQPGKEISLAGGHYLRAMNLRDSRAEQPEEWTLYGKRGVLGEKNYELTVAFQDEPRLTAGVLYSFFQTSVSFRFPGLLHGTFELSDTRNELSQRDGFNQLLFSEAAWLIAGAAGQLAAKLSGPTDYRPLQLAMVETSSLHSLIQASGFAAKLAAAIKTQSIFPAISGAYITWADAPVYYAEPEFAAYLPPDEFGDVLISCDDQGIRELIYAYGPTTYNVNEVIAALAAARKIIPVDDYARLIAALPQYLDKEELTQGICYDASGSILSPPKHIFIPTGDEQYALPPDVGAQILDEDLTKALKRVLGTESDAVLAEQLSRFHLREFHFKEVVEELIAHFNAQPDRVKKLPALHQHIFSFYSAEKTPPEAWAGSDIPILNRNGKMTLAGKVYFGKDQGGRIAETLFHYDTGKLVAGPERFQQPGGETWQRYLSWMGVARLPRRRLSSPEQYLRAYGDHAMRLYDYKKPIEDRLFDNFSEFKQSLDHYDELYVLTVDDLEDIFAHNKAEDLLAWLDADTVVYESMRKDREPNKSYLSIKLPRSRERYVDGGRLPSYLRWRIAQTSWLPAESGMKAIPDRCTTAASISPEFSPLIERPKLDPLLLRKLEIDSRRSDELLYACGVHRSVVSFSTGMLYEMLLTLRKADESGRKARAIYNQLAQHHDDESVRRLDRNDPVRKRYFESGEVFCRDGSWAPYREVFYLNDKHLGESITDKFNTIYIDRRRGKDKIEKLFGVLPLENLQMSLEAAVPARQDMDTQFGQDIMQFKPYVYAFRRAADKGAEREAISKARFRLVSQLQVRLVKESVEHLLELSDFEFLILPKDDVIYIKVPATVYQFGELKEDIHFCSAVGEIFSALIDVEAQRQQIRELYSRSRNGRDEILRTELDDPQLRLLTAARADLKLVVDAKADFWRAFTRCLSRKGLRTTTSDKEMLAELIKRFPKSAQVIGTVFDVIDYDDLSSEQTCANVLKLLEKYGIGLSQFNTYCYPPVSTAALYAARFRTVKETERNIYRERYYQYCLKRPELHKSFRREINRYHELTLPGQVTEPFDAERFLQQAVSKLFGELPALDPDSPTADERYLANKAQLTALAAAQSIQRALLDSFLDDQREADSLLYFEDDVETVLDLLMRWTRPANGSGGSPTGGAKRRRLQFNGEPVLYDDLFDLRQQLDTRLSDIDISAIALEDIKINRSPVQKTELGEKTTFKRGGRTPAQHEETGFLGEFFVYHFLQSGYAVPGSVQWVSKYAKECGLASEDGNGAGYDISYVSREDGLPRYVEVKVMAQDDAFHISSTEVRFGELHKKSHELFLLRNLSDVSKLKIDRLAGLFNYQPGKSFNENDRFTVLNDNYILKFRKQEKKKP